MNINKLPTDLIDAAKGSLSPFMKRYEYSPESLVELEGIIDTTFPVKGKPALATTYIPFGIHLGETIVRSIEGAKWVLPGKGENLFDAKIEVPLSGGDADTVELYPFVRVMKYFEDRSNGLKSYYDFVNLSAFMPPDISNAPAGGKWSKWKETRPGGIKWRMQRIDKEKNGDGKKD